MFLQEEEHKENCVESPMNAKYLEISSSFSCIAHSM